MSESPRAAAAPRATVAVVVPTRDRSHLVCRAVASVAAQARQADEIVVIDDGSTDDTVDSVRRLHPEAQVVRQDPLGPAVARNRGIREAKSEWIAFLDSDDEWEPEKLALQLEAVAASGRLVCHTGEVLVGQDGVSQEAEQGPKPEGRIYQACVSRQVISPSTVLIHRSVFDEIGLFDEELPACEDYDLWLRIAARYPVTLVDRPLVRRHVGHRDQLSQSLWGLDRFRVRALERAWRTLDLAAEERITTLETVIEKLSEVVAGARERRRQDLIEDLEHRIPHYERLLLLERIGRGLEW